MIFAYSSSKTCCKCKNIKQDLKGDKIYNCSECNLIIDRDINAAIKNNL
jgi:putative transposase